MSLGFSIAEANGDERRGNAARMKRIGIVNSEVSWFSMISGLPIHGRRVVPAISTSNKQSEYLIGLNIRLRI